MNNTYLTKDGKEYTIREAIETDAQKIIDYAKILFNSTNQVLTTSEEYNITFEDEEKWITNSAKNQGSIILLAETNNQVIGLLDFSIKPKKKQRHSGEFGVSIHPDFQAQGIGKKLIQSLIIWAKGVKQIEKIYLQVFESNKHAIKLYKDIGFIEEGKQIKAIKQKTGEYVDLLQMCMFL